MMTTQVDRNFDSIELQDCPSCGGSAAIIYVAPEHDPRFPAAGVCECRDCQAEWTVRLDPAGLIALSTRSSASVDWSPEWIGAMSTRADG